MTFSRLLTEHASPTLAGLKCACLVSLKSLSTPAEELMVPLAKKGLRFFPLRNKKGMALLLVYRPKMLRKALAEEKAREVLITLGYEEDLHKALVRLRERFLEEDCPHEIGLFLNYPAQDVKGFIENKGKNFKLSGLWKVYGDEEEARDLFRRYEKCRRIYTSCYEKGKNILQLCITA